MPPALSHRFFSALRRGIIAGVWQKRFAQYRPLLFSLLCAFQLLVVGLLGLRALGHASLARSFVRLPVLASAPDQTVQEFYTSLVALPGIERVSFVSREQEYALQREENLELIASLESSGIRNPFEDSFRITLSSVEGIAPLAHALRREEGRVVVDPEALPALSLLERDLAHTALLMRTGNVFFTLVFAAVLIVFLILLQRIGMQEGLFRETRTLRILGAGALESCLSLIAETTTMLLPLILGSALFASVIFLLVPIALPHFGDLFRDDIVLFGPAIFALEILGTPLFVLFSLVLPRSPFPMLRLPFFARHESLA